MSPGAPWSKKVKKTFGKQKQKKEHFLYENSINLNPDLRDLQVQILELSWFLR